MVVLPLLKRREKSDTKALLKHWRAVWRGDLGLEISIGRTAIQANELQAQSAVANIAVIQITLADHQNLPYI